MNRRRFRTSAAAVAAITLSALGLLGAAPASANPHPTALVYLRVEGATSTIFEGWVTTTPHDVTTDAGGTHPCDGLNNNVNATAGPTPTTALDDASNAAGFTFDGDWMSIFNDFQITRIGPDSQTPTQFWGVLDNYKFTPVSGCQAEVKDGDQVLWAYDAFNKVHFLELTGPSTATANVPFTVTVTDGSTGQPVQGATVGGQTTGSDGKATLTIATPGTVSLKAEAPASVRSNALAVDVQKATTTTIVGSSFNPSTFGFDVIFRAVVSPTDGNGTVGFFADGSSSPISGCGAAPLTAVGGGFRASCDAGSALAVGNHPILVVYSGDSAYQRSSAELSGGQQVNAPALTPQNITFPPLPNRSIVDSPFALTGVTGGGSGKPITFTASGGKCTVKGKQVKLNHTGICTITAHQAAAPGFAAAPAVSQSFTIGAKPTLSIGDANTVEGNSGTHPLTFTVTLSQAVTVPVTVDWMTANGSAKAPSDYIAGSGTLTFAPGQTSSTLNVLVKGDRIKEPNEVFFVLLDNPHKATIADPSGTGGIMNDD
jgi:hypothetical protein